MKKIHICFLAVLILAAACKEDSSKSEKQATDLLSTDLVKNPRTASGISPEELAAMPTMDFRDTIHDFGDIREGEVVSHKFSFTNNGKNPLIISNARGSCGCTAPNFPREPIPPGEKGYIEVMFNSAGREGHQEKAVYISSNTAKATHVLHIKGMVKKR